MSPTALFGNSLSRGIGSSGNNHLVEFRAGRMTLKGRMVYPDKRKGLLYIYQGEDSLMHFCWKDRTTGEVEDDLLIFPDDCEFVRVKECTTGRVYVLKFKSFAKKYFFWIQEPKTDKDDEYCRRINEVLNNPPSSRGRGLGGAAQNGELQSLLNNMSQQQLMQLFGRVGQMGGLPLLNNIGNSGSSSGNNRASTGDGATRASSVASRTETSLRTPTRARATPSTPPNTSSATEQRSAQVALSDLQRYFAGENKEPEGDAASAASSVHAPRVDFAAALTMPEVLSVAETVPAVERLAPHLPAAPPAAAADDVRTTLLSPQFAQAASLFSSALTSGQMAPVISQFGLGSEATSAASGGDLQGFFKALEKTTNVDNTKTQKDSKDDKPKDNTEKDKDGDMGMSLD